MKTMTCRLLLPLLLLAGSLVAGLPASAADIVLRLHHMLPADAAVVRLAMVPWARQIESQSGGRIAIEFYPGMQLGGTPDELYDQVKNGEVELAWTVLGYSNGAFPKSEAFELPFMLGDAETGSMAFQAYYEKDMRDELKDVHVIAVHVHGPGVLHARPGLVLDTIDKLKDIRFRGASRMVNALLEKAGSLPIIMAVTSVPEAFRTGMIDAAVAPWEVAPAIRLEEMAPEHTELAGGKGLFSATFLLAMNKKSYDSLPADLKAVIDANSGIRTAGLFGRAMDEGDRAGRQAASAAGHTIRALDAAETARFRALGDMVKADWIKQMNARGLDGAGLVRDAEQLIQSPPKS